MNTEDTSGLIKKGEYTFWKKADQTKPYIIKYIKEKFPNRLIIREFNKIDLVVLEENLPIEIQSTIVIEKSNQISHSQFESVIRKQIEDNIENYDKCWFFFDMEYYRYLNESLSNPSINLDWFAKYVKDNKLKVFIVKYSGEIKELVYEHLSFIRRMSNTCDIGYDDDRRILNRNKIKIMSNVLNGYKFTQEEIDSLMTIFDNDSETSLKKFLEKDKTDIRKRLYLNIIKSVGDLKIINKFLNTGDSFRNGIVKVYCNNLGIFDKSSFNSALFLDKFNICQYFPGYVRNKDVWNRIRGLHIKDDHLRYMFSLDKDKRQTKLEF